MYTVRNKYRIVRQTEHFNWIFVFVDLMVLPFEIVNAFCECASISLSISLSLSPFFFFECLFLSFFLFHSFSLCPTIFCCKYNFLGWKFVYSCCAKIRYLCLTTVTIMHLRYFFDSFITLLVWCMWYFLVSFTVDLIGKCSKMMLTHLQGIQFWIKLQMLTKTPC